MIGGIGAASIARSHEHTSTRWAAHAANSATVSAICTCSPEHLKVVPMTAKTSGDSTRGVSGIIFLGIQASFTTQGLARDIRSPPLTYSTACDPPAPHTLNPAPPARR